MTSKERYLQLRKRFDEARANNDPAMANIVRAEMAKVCKEIPASEQGDLDTCPGLQLSDFLELDLTDPT